jgi:hypothetical protein
MKMQLYEALEDFTLFEKGDPSDKFFIILEGTV